MNPNNIRKQYRKKKRTKPTINVQQYARQAEHFYMIKSNKEIVIEDIDGEARF